MGSEWTRHILGNSTRCARLKQVEFSERSASKVKRVYDLPSEVWFTRIVL